jgi:hypothetical protein
VEAANDGMDAVLPAELSHVADDVHDARMAAAGQDDEALSANGRDQGLVVQRSGHGSRRATWLPWGKSRTPRTTVQAGEQPRSS